MCILFRATPWVYVSGNLRVDTERIKYDFDENGTPNFTRVLDRSQDNLNAPPVGPWERRRLRRQSITKSPTIGQRTSVTTTGTAFSGGARDRDWGYDALGQLVKESDANDTSFNRGFAFDGIGNRTASIEGDTDTTATGAVNYTPDALNQYDSITDPASQIATPTYDDDGNATTLTLRESGLPGGSFEHANLIWDAENRLIAIEDSNGLTIAEYAYDSQSRRIRRTIPGDTDIIYLYDGWNPIAEYSTPDLQTFTLVTKILWGMDLSGSMQGAGGVGGLLSVTKASGTPITRPSTETATSANTSTPPEPSSPTTNMMPSATSSTTPKPQPAKPAASATASAQSSRIARVDCCITVTATTTH